MFGTTNTSGTEKQSTFSIAVVSSDTFAVTKIKEIEPLGVSPRGNKPFVKPLSLTRRHLSIYSLSLINVM